MRAKNKPIEVVIKWAPGDVETLRPDWSLEQCEEALENMAKHLKDRSIELGWEIMEELLEDEN